MTANLERRFIRRRIIYVPNFKRDVERWVRMTIATQFWRVRGLCEHEDLYQDAWILFLRLKQKYVVTNAAHFCKLFRVSFANHLHSLASERTHKLPTPISSLERVDELSDHEPNPDHVPIDVNLGPAICAIKDTIRRNGHNRVGLAVALRKLAPGCDFPRHVNSAGTKQLLTLMVNEAIARPHRARRA